MSDPKFFVPVFVKLSQLADACGARLEGGGDAEAQITGASPVESAASGQVTFVDNPKYLKFLENTAASAVFCSEKHLPSVPKNVSALVHATPYKAYGQALAMLYPTALRPQPVTGETGVSKAAHVAESATLEDNVLIEPGAVIGEHAAIGSGSVILPGAVIGANVQIGRNCTIGANVTITNALVGNDVILHNGVQIGQDGFGFSMGAGGHHKVPQIGRVIVQDRVEIGANSTVDRGANRDTIIGEGTKIDNLVQIGHNVVIGRHCVIVGLAGVAGSATLGDYVVVAGQAGIVGHTHVGDGAQIGGGSGVHGDVEPGARVMGYPAIPASKWMREAAKQLIAAKREKKKG